MLEVLCAHRGVTRCWDPIPTGLHWMRVQQKPPPIQRMRFDTSLPRNGASSMRRIIELDFIISRIYKLSMIPGKPSS